MIRQYAPLPGNAPRYERWKNKERLIDVLASDMLDNACHRSRSSAAGFWSTFYCNQPTVDGIHCAEHAQNNI
jgi:hypothetical protein